MSLAASIALGIAAAEAAIVSGSSPLPTSSRPATEAWAENSSRAHHGAEHAGWLRTAPDIVARLSERSMALVARNTEEKVAKPELTTA